MRSAVTCVAVSMRSGWGVGGGRTYGLVAIFCTFSSLKTEAFFAPVGAFAVRYLPHDTASEGALTKWGKLGGWRWCRCARVGCVCVCVCV